MFCKINIGKGYKYRENKAIIFCINVSETLTDKKIGVTITERTLNIKSNRNDADNQLTFHVCIIQKIVSFCLSVCNLKVE